MARYQIELNGQPISMETFATREAAVHAIFTMNLPRGADVRECDGVNIEPGDSPAFERSRVSFGTPPTGGK